MSEEKELFCLTCARPAQPECAAGGHTTETVPASPALVVGEMRCYWEWKTAAGEWRPGCRFLTEFIMRSRSGSAEWLSYWHMNDEAEAFMRVTRCGWPDMAGAQVSIDELHKWFPDIECRAVEGECPYASECENS